jgi:hypothetical protein
MPRLVIPILAFAIVLLPFYGNAKPITELKSLKLDVPVPDKMFPDGPGSDTVNANCLVCHSEDHVMNQPNLTKAEWAEVVEKMIKAYKAPIDEKDASTIVDYLFRIKGKT